MCAEHLLPAECCAKFGNKEVTLYFSVAVRRVGTGDKRKVSTKTNVQIYIVLFMMSTVREKNYI